MEKIGVSGLFLVFLIDAMTETTCIQLSKSILLSTTSSSYLLYQKYPKSIFFEEKMSEAPSAVGKKLEGKIAIITGGASGIGEATAHLFSDEGARMVVIADIQDELGQSVASSIGSHRCTYIHCDVSDENQVKSLVDSTVSSYGRLDIMFSNAGFLNKGQTTLEIDLQAMDRLFAVNVRGMAACVKHAARSMVESSGKGGGESSIICTASTASVRGNYAGTEDYVMSKHAVLGLVKSASNELGKYGIRVNCVSPGPVVTPLLMDYIGTKDVAEAENASSSMGNGKGMVSHAHHVADAVLFLASSQSAFVSGHNLVVDGGFLAR